MSIRKNTLPFSIFLLLGVWLLGCRLVSSIPGTATPSPPPAATASVSSPAAVHPTPTQTVTDELSPPASETPAARQPTPTPRAPTTTPKPTELRAGPFRMIGPIPPVLLGEVTGLRADPDGSLWVMTTYGYMLLRDGKWTMQPSGHAQTLIGADDAGRMWFFLEGDGSQMYYWDGGPEFTLTDTGWIPVPNPTRLTGRGVLTDPDGRGWLVTEQDVRVFDGARWSVFSWEDLGMPPPTDQDIYTWFTLELVGDPGQIWVGECDWTGPGPDGGGGARWFDGQTWRGAESPVASGCVTAIREDSLGHVWVGVDSDLWRYDPVVDEWERFPPPQPPEGYRFVYITDIAFDPSGEPWPLFPRCGGASCVGAEARYRLHAGEWIEIGEASYSPQILAFDSTGTPWLFLGGLVYRIEAAQLVEPPAAKLDVAAATVDAAGRVWVAGAGAGGEMAVWVLETEEQAADTLAVCPPGSGENITIPSTAEGDNIIEILEPQILAYLSARGDAQGLQATLSRFTLTDSSGTDWQARSQVFTTDVTGDTTPEVVVDLNFFVEGQFANGALFVYRCQAGQYVGGAVTLIGAQIFSDSDPDPGIRAIQDMNANGKPEIVFSYIVVIGTHANFTREFRIIEWDGSQFVDLIQSDRNRPYAAEVLNGDGVIRDTDGDGVLELELTNGVGRGPDASALDRARTDIWAWNGAAFTLAYTQAASPPVFRIHAVWDGDAATLRGDYDDALAFYQQAIFDHQLLGWSQGRIPSDAAYEGSATPTPDLEEHLRLSAYGWYRIILLQIVRGYLLEAQIAYDTLQETFPEGTVGSQYSTLAATFWKEYDASEDLSAACDNTVDYAAAHVEEILTPLGSSFYGFGQRDYAAGDVCPLQLLPSATPMLPIVTFTVEIEDVAAGKQLTFE